jgi:2,5-diamino-6-(ribosylamino)-4(3H)-pyrimidinone 5'-phosphate reductase
VDEGSALDATRLYPLPPREIEAHSIYADLKFPMSGRDGLRKPYVIVNMITTLDGKTTSDGKSSRIGSAVDRQLMRTLRSKADAVLIGANTLRAERLSLALDEPARAPHPLAVIVTATGDVPLERNLILGEGQDLLVISSEGAKVEIPRGRGRAIFLPACEGGAFVLSEALEVLKTEYAVNLLLVEGGPSLNYSLVSDDLVDELFLTLSPKLLGGTPEEALAILEGSEFSSGPRSLNLLAAHLCKDELFLRYEL